MKRILITFVLMAFASTVLASEMMEQKVFFEAPKDGAVVKNPVKVCIGAVGVEAEPASQGVNPHKGHHHILVDVDLPADLSKPIPKDDQHIHMGDGSKCKDLTLSPGKHKLSLLFANGAHVPMVGVKSETVTITVGE